MNSISKFNGEKYYDPTAYQALVNLEMQDRSIKYIKFIYISGSFFGDDIEFNVSRAKIYARFTVESGNIPVIPFLMYHQYIQSWDRKQKEIAMSKGLVLMEKCQEMWVFESKVTVLMAKELKKAKSVGIPIKFFNDNFQEIKKND